MQVSSSRKSSHVVPESGYHVCEETGICESACCVNVIGPVCENLRCVTVNVNVLCMWVCLNMIVPVGVSVCVCLCVYECECACVCMSVSVPVYVGV